MAALLRSPPLDLRYDLTCSYYPLPLCLSCFSADESPPTASPIKAASEAKPPVRRQSAAEPPSLARYGVRAVDTGNDSQKTRGEATYTAPTLRSACSPSSCKLPMSGVEGNAPRPSLGDTKGVFSSRREYPLCLAVALSAALSMQRQRRCTPPSPARGDQKGYPLREENTPFAWQWRSAPHYPCSASGAAPPRPPRGEIKGDTLFGKRINPCNIKVSQ